MKNFIRGLAACSALLIVGGCSWLPSSWLPSGTRLGWDAITMSAASDANQNSPVAIDIVLPLDSEMLDRLIELPASKWFQVRADLQKTFPKSLIYRSWELVPGQNLQIDADVLGSPRVQAAFIFADYAAPGAHRIRIENLKDDVLVRLDRNSFSISEKR